MNRLQAGHTVLAPNAELAAAIFDAVERHHRDAGELVWPTPRVRDFSSWLREAHLRRQIEQGAALRELGDIEEREIWRSIVAGGDEHGALIEPAAAAAAARGARRAMYDYGIPPAAVAAYDSEETRALLGWIARFDAACRDLGCISGDELLGSFERPPEPVAWIESPAWRPAPRRWLARHAHAPLRAAEASRPARASIYAAATSADEAAAAAAWARDGLQADPGFRAWIGIADLAARRTELQDAFDAALVPQRYNLDSPDRDSPYALAGGAPLAGYAPVRAALDLLSLAHGAVPFAQFSRALRAPELAAGDAEAAGAALLDLELRAHAPHELLLREWLALGGRLMRERSGAAAPLLDRLRSANARLESLRGEHALSRWVPLWIEAFERAPWSQRVRWSSGEFQAAERAREVLASLAAADRIFGPRSRSEAERLLAQALRDTAFQPQTGIPSVWVSGQIQDPWLNYDGLWVSGLDAQHWPPAPEPLPFLPTPLQRSYGVIGAAAQTQREFAEELQSRWRVRAAYSTFSFVRGDAGAVHASPLLPAAALLPPQQVASLPHWRCARGGAPQLESLRDDQAPPFGGAERTHGVATLRAQSLCAFRGFAETRLDSAPLRLPAPGFDAMQRGILVHAALERIWRVLRGSAALKSLPAVARARLIDSSVAEALADVCRERDPGARWRERERRRLGEVLAQWLDTEALRADFEVERLEAGRQVARHAGLEFNCRIDRVDRLADGARVLIDYKTGHPTADWRGDRPDNPQLPLYALLNPEALIAVAYGRVAVGDCEFMAETSRGGVFTPAGRRTQLEGEPDFAALLTVWAARIERLAGEFGAGRAEVAPKRNACQYCHLRALCRIAATSSDATASSEATAVSDG